MDTNDAGNDPLVDDEAAAAAAEAAAIGGEGPASDNPDPAMQPVEEAGGGVAEGFEQAEGDLIENASHGDGVGNPEVDAIDNEHVEAQRATVAHGEANEVDVTEVRSDPDSEHDDDPAEGTDVAFDR
jgi:hypothetical protein